MAATSGPTAATVPHASLPTTKGELAPPVRAGSEVGVDACMPIASAGSDFAIYRVQVRASRRRPRTSGTARLGNLYRIHVTIIPGVKDPYEACPARYLPPQDRLGGLPQMVGVMERRGTGRRAPPTRPTPAGFPGTIETENADLVILRAAWDYTERVTSSSLDRAGWNLLKPSVVAWNIDKHYLLDLADAGVDTYFFIRAVPTARGRT